MSKSKPDKQSSIRNWSTRSRETLQDALALIQQGGSAAGIVDRSYFAMHYAVMAVLAAIDQAPPAADRALSLFDDKIIKPNILPRKMARVLHEAFELRETQVIGDSHKITNEQAFEVYNSALEFIGAVEDYLAKLP